MVLAAKDARLTHACYSFTSMDQLHGFDINSAPQNFDPKRTLPSGFLEFFLRLHERFTPRQRELVGKRKRVLADAHAGKMPNHLGINNIHAALRGELTYFDKKRNKQIGINESKTVIFTRARGLHLSQRLPGIKGDDLASASLYDVCRMAFDVDPGKLKHPLSFYIPKSESAEEALWWNDLFNEIEKLRGWQHGYIKCMALVESHPQAFQMEEFLYNLRDHMLGLNLGRWDYMASLIHFNLNDPEWVLPDRNTIPHDIAFFQNLRDLLVSICHGRGTFAIGGMTALYPDRTNPELNARALAVLEKDKKNESDRGFDGAWTGHPDQNTIAVEQFPVPSWRS